MPLSEHEQRLLDEIEQALYAEDPKFANSYQGTDVRTHYRRRVVRAVIGVAIGLGVLVAGVVINPIIGVAGFVIMLAAASFGVASWQRMTGHRVPATRERAPKAPRAERARLGHRSGGHRSGGRRSGEPGSGGHRSLVQRLEDRWQRRQDDRDRPDR